MYCFVPDLNTEKSHTDKNHSQNTQNNKGKKYKVGNSDQ